ncbi:MAG: TrbG/VirB9 family P-type conjugative transfer protein, partial [Gammaproteobacteria bacterium]|nr:TrbG/VirB9 family P-type conjugative transfer protein [Gammaproteobacteria bacterium]
MSRRAPHGIGLLSLLMATSLVAQDPRIRNELYAPDEVYRLPAFVGYQIDLEFESGESFVGLGAGDAEGVTFAAAGNHLFLKPRAAAVRTNLTVLTSRRAYHFQYVVSAREPDPDLHEVLYVLRFLYPVTTVLPVAAPPVAGAGPPRHDAYLYAGSPDLKPVGAWDDGVRTWLRFAAEQELPAVFARNADGSESLVNLHVEGGVVVVHRVASGFTLRRGALSGCVVNQQLARAPG